MEEFWEVNTDPERVKPLVFASCGSFSDGTKFFVGQTDPNTASWDGDEKDIRMYYEQKLRSIEKYGQPDGIAIETIPSLNEGLIADEALQKTNTPGWIPFICRSRTATLSGDLITSCVRELLDPQNGFDNIVAIGVNCVHPKYVEDLLRAIQKTKSEIGASAKDVLVVAYPNSGEIWDSRQDHRCWHGQEQMKVLTGQDAISMRDAGADLVGGCCRVNFDQIAQFKDTLEPSYAGSK